MTENTTEEKDNRITVNVNNTAVYIWAIIENMVTIGATCGMYIYTESAWCFLFLLNLNSIKSKKESK